MLPFRVIRHTGSVTFNVTSLPKFVIFGTGSKANLLIYKSLRSGRPLAMIGNALKVSSISPRDLHKEGRFQ